jgi:hypothetical protein
MRNALLAILMLLCSVTPAAAQVDIGIGFPGVRIGINVPVYPRLVVVPGYPVYYAPGVSADYFFYDGMYWLFQDDNWYMSSWYNGPWELVAPDAVPLFILRVPVRYYRRPPPYFRGWSSDEPPRWGEHWGGGWEQSHSGWEHWDHRSVPAPAPLPTYQRQYSGNRYPSAQQQQVLQRQNYRYQPREAVAQHYRAQPAQSQAVPATRASHTASQTRSTPQQSDRSASRTASTAQGQPMTRERASQTGSQENRQAAVAGAHAQGGPAASYHRKPSQPVATQREQASMSRGSGNATHNAGPGQQPKQAQSKQPQLAAAPRQEPARHQQPSQVEHQQQVNRAAENDAHGKGPAQPQEPEGH